MIDAATLAKIDEFRARTTASPWTHIPRSDFADSLTARAKDGNLINTAHVNLCGPAAFFRNLALDYPNLYVALAIDLYDKGRSSFYGHDIKAYDKLYRWTPTKNKAAVDWVDPVDWVVLATFRNSENSVVHFNSVNDGFAGITMPHSLASWYKSLGYTSVNNSTSVWFTRGIDHLLKASEYFRHGFRVCLFVSDQMLYPDSMNSRSWIPNHWVVLDSPVVVNIRQKTKFVKPFNVWCWGEVKTIPHSGSVTEHNLTKNYYGYVIARA